MKRFCTITFLGMFIIAAIHLSAQDKKIDSLKTLLNSVDDKKKADVLAQIAEFARAEEQYTYAQKALKLAYKYNLPKAKSLALYSLSMYYLDKNDFKKAREYADSNFVLAFQSLDSLLISKAHYIHAANYFAQAYYNNAALFYKQAIEYCPTDKQAYKIFLLQNYAISLYNLSNYQAALKILLDIIEYYNKVENYISVAHIYNMLGSIYIKMADTTSGFIYYNKALKVAPNLDAENIFAETLLNLGVLYYDRKMIDSARYYFYAAKKYAIKDSINSIISDINTALGDLYLDINEKDSALYYYQQVIDLSEKVNDTWAMVYGYIGLAKVYNKKQNYGKSLFYLYKIEPTALDVNANELLIDFYDIFAETHALSGNYRDAYHYMKLYNQYSDQFYREKSAHELAHLKIKYETEKKEQENKRLLIENKFKEQNIKNQNYITLSISILLIFVLIFAISFLYEKQKIQKAHQLLAEKNAEIINQNEEIKKQAQKIEESYIKLKELDEYKLGLRNMIVHDLKNPLNIILNMAQNELVKEAAKKMFHLVSDILDVSKLEEAKMILNLENIPIKNIIQNAISKTSFSANISKIQIIDNSPDELIVYADRDITERILINLLSNAIKFSPQQNKVIIDAQEELESIIVSVTDFGIGIPENEQKLVFDKFVQFKAVNSGTVRSTGLGLTFCKLAVEAQGGEIGVESNSDKGSVFWFRLPAGK